jgi:hypothetical protein
MSFHICEERELILFCHISDYALKAGREYGLRALHCWIPFSCHFELYFQDFSEDNLLSFLYVVIFSSLWVFKATSSLLSCYMRKCNALLIVIILFTGQPCLRRARATPKITLFAFKSRSLWGRFREFFFYFNITVHFS